MTSRARLASVRRPAGITMAVDPSLALATYRQAVRDVEVKLARLDELDKTMVMYRLRLVDGTRDVRFLTSTEEDLIEEALSAYTRQQRIALVECKQGANRCCEALEVELDYPDLGVPP